MSLWPRRKPRPCRLSVEHRLECNRLYVHSGKSPLGDLSVSRLFRRVWKALPHRQSRWEGRPIRRLLERRGLRLPAACLLLLESLLSPRPSCPFGKGGSPRRAGAIPTHLGERLHVSPTEILKSHQAQLGPTFGRFIDPLTCRWNPPSVQRFRDSLHLSLERSAPSRRRHHGPRHFSPELNPDTSSIHDLVRSVGRALKRMKPTDLSEKMKNLFGRRSKINAVPGEMDQPSLDSGIRRSPPCLQEFVDNPNASS